MSWVRGHCWDLWLGHQMVKCVVILMTKQAKTKSCSFTFFHLKSTLFIFSVNPFFRLTIPAGRVEVDLARIVNCAKLWYLHLWLFLLCSPFSPLFVQTIALVPSKDPIKSNLSFPKTFSLSIFSCHCLFHWKHQIETVWYYFALSISHCVTIIFLLDF